MVSRRTEVIQECGVTDRTSLGRKGNQGKEHEVWRRAFDEEELAEDWLMEGNALIRSVGGCGHHCD